MSLDLSTIESRVVADSSGSERMLLFDPMEPARRRAA